MYWMIMLLLLVVVVAVMMIMRITISNVCFVLTSETTGVQLDGMCSAKQRP